MGGVLKGAIARLPLRAGQALVGMSLAAQTGADVSYLGDPGDGFVDHHKLTFRPV